ncbi:DUF2933 domain-containing protein [Nonomuraea sp. NPDC049400]|uniref:DUF2933 domain-containing protein n=1 Tax=Nonomuraea sp. NPDC049400 TaxID=3364352 RepID=UPI0037A87629
MMKQHVVLAAVAVAAAVLAVWAGAPVYTVLLAAVFLVCPVIMLWMMRSMGADHTERDDRVAERGQVRGPKGPDAS